VAFRLEGRVGTISETDLQFRCCDGLARLNQVGLSAWFDQARKLARASTAWPTVLFVNPLKGRIRDFKDSMPRDNACLAGFFVDYRRGLDSE
jgi:hypothetical protein